MTPATAPSNLIQFPSQNQHGIYSHARLMATTPEPLRFAVEGLIVEGQMGVLAGPFAIGKTMLGLQFSQHLALGMEFMGRAIRRHYRVAFIDTENGRSEITSRLRDQAEAMQLSESDRVTLGQNWLYVDTDDEGPLQYLRLDRKGIEQLKRFVQEHGIEVLIIDNLGRVLAGKETEEDKIKDLFASLKRLRNECPTLRAGMMLFLHHLTKQNPEFVPDLLSDPYAYLARVRGSGRILDFSEIRLAFDQQKDSQGEMYYVLNGIVRSGRVSPVLLQRSTDGKTFQRHSDSAVVIDRLFAGKSRQLELVHMLPTTFRFSDLLKFQNKDGGQFYRQTITDTLDALVLNNIYQKLPDESYIRVHPTVQ